MIFQDIGKFGKPIKKVFLLSSISTRRLRVAINGNSRVRIQPSSSGDWVSPKTLRTDLEQTSKRHRIDIEQTSKREATQVPIRSL